MDKLKLVLKKALADGASQATLRIGEETKIIVQHGRSVPLPEFGVVDQTWIDGLYKALFPREGLALRAEQLVRSQFNIVNVGKVNVIADPRPPKSLYLFFPPSGELLSQDFWISLAAPKATPPPVETPTKAPPVDPGAEAATRIANVTESVSQKPTVGATTASRAVKQESTQTRQMNEMTSMTETKVPVPEVLVENKARLALILSNDATVLSQCKTVAAGMSFFAYTLDSETLFRNILDRLTPQLICLDDATPNFQAILKKLYDMDIERRSQMTIILLSKSYKSNDSKAAFAMSVDGVIQRDALKDLKQLAEKFHADRKATFQGWSDLATKV